uniref:DNA alkylation repair n=1 Tax=Actinomadura madurae TaxID=1993 RepID=B0BLN0_9ACTN|nr:DNA alkylation repair [Actinomadura madurae]
MPEELTAAAFLERMEPLKPHRATDDLVRHFRAGPGEVAEGDVFNGVRMGDIFKLAKEFVGMPCAEIEKLLEDQVHEVRVGALSIMGKDATRKKITMERRKELYDLYLRRIDRVNHWDLVDLSSHHVIGGYLYESGEPRGVLYELARSDNLWARRIAVFSTMYFVRRGDLDDTFEISEILAYDDQDLVQKAVGGMLREAGKQDRPRLLSFLDEHAAGAPRIMLRYAIEHLDKPQRTHYLNLGKQAR